MPNVFVYRVGTIIHYMGAHIKRYWVQCAPFQELNCGFGLSYWVNFGLRPAAAAHSLPVAPQSCVLTE